MHVIGVATENVQRKLGVQHQAELSALSGHVKPPTCGGTVDATRMLDVGRAILTPSKLYSFI